MTTMRKKNYLSSVLVLLVFAVFVVSVLMVLLTGADVVQKLNERDRRSYDQRTIVQYITTRVRQADEQGMVEVREIEGKSVLALGEMIEGIRYDTLVYCWDGYLCELFTESGLDMGLEFGEWILPVEDIRFTDEGTHILVGLSAHGEEQSMILSLRSERGNTNEK